MCFYWQNISKHDTKLELNLEEFEKISKKLGKLLQLSLTGGEPFLREDLVEITKIYVKNTDPMIVTIPTNGLMPEKISSTAEKILKTCSNTFFRFSISIDGIGALHDSIRGVKGNFEKIKDTYSRLNKLKSKYNNFNIDMGTVISKYNQDNVENVFHYVEDNFKVDNHYFALARGDTRLKNAKDTDIEVYKKMITYKRDQEKITEKRPFSSIFREVFELNTEILLEIISQNRMVIPCVAGKNMLIVSESGDLFPCEILNMKIGNLRDYDYDAGIMIKTEKAKEIRKYIGGKKCFCTFECAINASIIFNPILYPRIFYNIIKNRIKLAFKRGK